MGRGVFAVACIVGCSIIQIDKYDDILKMYKICELLHYSVICNLHTVLCLKFKTLLPLVLSLFKTNN